MELFKIKHRYTQKVLFQDEFESFRDCVEMAIKLKISLSGALLSRMDLSGMDLSGMDLSWADLSESNLSRVNLSKANLSGADLSGSKLSRTDLSRANFSGADLSWVNFSGANLYRAKLYKSAFPGAKKNKIEITEPPIQITGLKWNVIIFDHYMKIGCETHKISEWKAFDNERINEMDKKALGFCKKNKQFLLSACAANGRG